ncbi:MAG: EAL domain-containing protein [Lachnospiraceae bacterium]|nr:EAL domain-containing protein [Lachnospiraceae bacterium]
MNAAEKEDLEMLGIKAIMIMPIIINGAPGMYACFYEKLRERTWSIEEIKFINDSVKILQSILTRRVQRNSIASSYESIETILDNVGSAVYVKEVNSNRMLFANSIMKKTFSSEIEDGSIDEMIASKIDGESGVCEFYQKSADRTYDMYFTKITWVDGKKVLLCALYDISEKKIYQRRIEQQAYTDFLTGLYNRMCCERDLAKIIDETEHTGTNGALLYLDLDDFKHINDGLGHQYGDVLLKAISHSIQRIDGIQNTCYRMGGDEFVIIIPPESYDRRNHIVAEIKDVFAKPWFLKDADYYCTMSMGMVEFPENGTGVHDLIKKADIAMYEAKKSGKNRMAVYSDNIDSASHQRLDMEKNMRDATTAGFGEFEVYYQPIVDIKKPGDPCTGAEALIRWNSQEMGFISPGEFIPLAEYLGLINPIGNYVLRDACNTCRKWNDSGYPGYRINVNLSVVQLLQTDIVDIVEKTIKDSGINPHNLTLEVTESLAINDMERMKKILGSIKALGVRIALDDFGTGYSSLNHIREIPFDVIKVDQTFIKDLEKDSYAVSFVKMVGELAEAIGVNICVEGVETERQLDIMRDLPVDLIQGYYFDKPMTQIEFEKKYLPNMH